MCPESVKISFASSSMESMSDSVRISTVDAYSIRSVRQDGITHFQAFANVVRRDHIALTRRLTIHFSPERTDERQTFLE
jgi:hypothetical protein